LSRALQGRLRRDRAIVELTVAKSSVEGYSPDSNNVSTETEESPLLEAVTRERLLETQQAGEDLARSDLSSAEISNSAIITCNLE
jgi:hypothetical protein